MNKDRFCLWLKAKQNQLDLICGEALVEGFRALNGQDLELANQSLNSLYADTSSGSPLPGGDCDYSLPGVGPLYTPHWHGKRVHDGLAVLTPLIDMLADKPLSVLDVGAGTGGALWAWALTCCYLSEEKITVPKHQWFSLDSSASMIDQSERLWEYFYKSIPKVTEVVDRQTPVCRDWRNAGTQLTADLILGSYVFSRNDADDAAKTAAAFVELLNKTGASRLAIWTRTNKSRVQDELRKLLSNWTDVSPQSKNLFLCPLRGRMKSCLEATISRFKHYNLPIDQNWARRFNWGNSPTEAAVLAMRRN